MATSVAKYLFDQSWEREQERLTGLERWADPASFRLLEGLGIEPGSRCLDVGAGAGSVTRWLARKVGAGGSVVSADLETGFLERLVHRPNVEIRRLDILSDEVPADEFDLVHARFVLVHLPERDLALERMIAAVRPGGHLAITDLDWTTTRSIDPAPPVQRVDEAVRRVFEDAGLELAYGSRLPIQLEEHGLTEVGGEAFIRYTRGDSVGAHVYRLSIERIREHIVAAGLASDGDIQQAQRRLLDPTYSTVSPTIWTAWGRKPLT